MPYKFTNNKGMGLIELVVLIVVIGILASVAMRSMTSSVEDVRRIRTEREMEMLSDAIVGDPSELASNHRSSFGYVGDVGAFPPNLSALRTNPGSYSTWNGPYLQQGFAEDTNGYKYDEWGKAYTYSGGITITSSGNGTQITKKIADASADYLLNSFTGVVKDASDSLPGAVKKDSVAIKIEIPNGAGSMTTKTYKPSAAGSFQLDSLPVGKHKLNIIYTPQNDTLNRYITILPRQKTTNPALYKFASNVFSGGGSGGCGTNSLILRPSGAGGRTDLSSSGCVNWQCVSESSADGDVTVVICNDDSNPMRDYYALPNPASSSCAPTRVTVYARARVTVIHGGPGGHHGDPHGGPHGGGSHGAPQGGPHGAPPGSPYDGITPLIIVNGTFPYSGTNFDLTPSYITYSSSWTTNPRTGTAWTWADINNLQIGVELSLEIHNDPAYCTQIWLEIEY
jgi:type II secretory pathway pseudopilin PulG